MLTATYMQYLFLKLTILHEYLMQHSLKLGGTNYHFKWVKVPGIAPYWKAWYNICTCVFCHISFTACPISLSTQLLLRFKWKFSKLLHGCLLPYADLFIAITVWPNWPFFKNIHLYHQKLCILVYDDLKKIWLSLWLLDQTILIE